MSADGMIASDAAARDRQGDRARRAGPAHRQIELLLVQLHDDDAFVHRDSLARFVGWIGFCFTQPQKRGSNMSIESLKRRTLLKGAAAGALSPFAVLRQAGAQSLQGLTIGVVYVGPRGDFG